MESPGWDKPWCALADGHEAVPATGFDELLGIAGLALGALPVAVEQRCAVPLHGLDVHVEAQMICRIEGGIEITDVPVPGNRDLIGNCLLELQFKIIPRPRKL